MYKRVPGSRNLPKFEEASPIALKDVDIFSSSTQMLFPLPSGIWSGGKPCKSLLFQQAPSLAFSCKGSMGRYSGSARIAAAIHNHIRDLPLEQSSDLEAISLKDARIFDRGVLPPLCAHHDWQLSLLQQ